MQSQWLFEAPFPSNEATRFNLGNYNQSTSEFFENPVHPDILQHCSVATTIVKNLSPFVNKKLTGKQKLAMKNVAHQATMQVNTIAARLSNNLSTYSIRDIDIALGCIGRIDSVYHGVAIKMPATVERLRAAALTQIAALKGKNLEASFEWDFENPTDVARALVTKLRSQGKKIIVNIGGTGARHEPPDAINVNPNTVAPRKNIPNWVAAKGEIIGSLFEPNTIDQVIGNRLFPGTVNWRTLAQGAYRVMRSGGQFKVNFYTQNKNEIVGLFTALQSAGFTNVQSVHDVMI